MSSPLPPPADHHPPAGILDTPPPIRDDGLEGTRAEEVVKEPNRFKRVVRVLGPGLITGASDDDPTAVATYAQAGAAFGTATLWTALVTLPMMAVVQYTCAKVGMVTGMGLAGVLRHYYPRHLLFPAIVGLLVANTVTIGANIGAIAAALGLLVPVPPGYFVIPVSLVILLVLTFGSYNVITSVFKWLALVLVAYVGAALVTRPDLGEVIRGTFIPTLSLDASFIAILVAILGTNVSPYLFFWQASQEVEEKVARGRRRFWQRRGATDEELRFASWDVGIGMLFSNLVVYFINLSAATALHATGQTSVQSAADAAAALRPIAGDAAFLLFAVGMIGAGFLSVPILAGSSAYAVSEVFGWRWGLDERPPHARRFYGVIAISTVVGTLINFVGIDAIEALIVASIVNGVLTPPLLVLVMLAANREDIMGARTNNRWTNLVGWLTTAVMALAALALVGVWIFGGA